MCVMTLSDFLLSKNLTQQAFGDLLVPPVTQGQVSQWLRGASRVTLEYAIEIGRVSKGKVTPVDLAAMYRGSQSQQVAEASE